MLWDDDDDDDDDDEYVHGRMGERVHVLNDSMVKREGERMEGGWLPGRRWKCRVDLRLHVLFEQLRRYGVMGRRLGKGCDRSYTSPSNRRRMNV